MSSRNFEKQLSNKLSSGVVGLNELPQFERNRVETLCNKLFPGSIVYGILRTPITQTSISGELRPVFAQTNNPYPFLMRFVGPEVMLVPDMAEGFLRAIKGALTHFGPQNFLWSVGESEGQIYYVRSYFPSTLGQIIDRYEYIELEDLLTVLVKIVEEVNNWHRAGFFHAHLSVENIFIDESGNVSIIDAMIGGATIAALSQIASDDVLVRYPNHEFAPEVLHGRIGKSADLYNLGSIINQLLPYSIVKGKAQRTRGIVSSLEKLSDRLMHREPNKRLHLELLKEELSKILKEYAILNNDNKGSAGEFDGQGKDHSDDKVRSNSERSNDLSRQRKEETDERLRALKERNESQSRKIKQPPPSIVGSSVSGAEEKKGNRPVPRGKIISVGAGTPSQLERRPDTVSVQPPQDVFTKKALDLLKSEQEELDDGTKSHMEIEHRSDITAKRADSRKSSILGGEFSSPIQDVSSVKSRGVREDKEYIGEDSEPTPIRVIDTAQKRSSSPAKLLLMVVSLLIGIFLYHYLSEESLESYSPEELSEMWSSPMRSRSEIVVRLALTNGNPLSQKAQSIIVESVLAGKKVSSPIDSQLIKVGYDPRWEGRLSPGDREAILVYASLPVAKNFRNFSLPQLSDNLNSVVLLALTAVLGEREQSSLSKFPIRLLFDLPAPNGGAFEALANIRPNLTCGDVETRLLAQIVAFGVSATDSVFEFLEDGSVQKLAVLGGLFIGDDKLSGDFLHTVLNHPNHRLTSEIAVWATKRGIIAWGDVSNSDKLRILSGQFPNGQVSPKVVALLFEHPEPKVRREAIAKAINEIHFAHPASVSILNSLAKDPSQLTPSQTIYLAQVLQEPNLEDRARLKKWLESSPPVPMLEEMLIATGKERKATVLDREILIHLREVNWKPTVEQLMRLVFHPEPLTRLYSYGQIFLLQDKALALKMLTEARKRETDSDFNRVLDVNIAQLTNMQERKN